VLLRCARASFTLVAALVIAAATFVASPAPAQAAAFPDTSGTSFDQAVQALVDAGVIEGCGDGSQFCPGRPVSRAQLASLLVRALDLPASDASPFRDVDGNTHEANINALAEAGITRGCTEDRFCPQQPISRAEMATMLVRAFPTSSTSTQYFNDIGGTHAGSINELAASGIGAGCDRPAGAFCPTESVQRQQAALFLARALDLSPRVEVKSLEERREAQAASSREQIWDDLAQCESGGNWSINTGNGYYGGLQFHIDTWRSVGGSGYPHQHTREEQIHRGEILQQRSGWGQWPACSRELGLR
jgi:hypothetical protein